MDTALVTSTEPNQFHALALASMLVLDSVTSPKSKRAYGRALRDFIAWYRGKRQPTFCKAVVQRYAAELREKARSPQNINQRLCALRKLSSESVDLGHIPLEVANGISNVKGIRAEGVRTGNWLTEQQAQDLIDQPDAATMKGLRDRAILCVLIGCGLRRTEVANLTFEHMQLRDSRWCIVDIVGKPNRKRTVPMLAWAKKAIDAWAEKAGISEGHPCCGYPRTPLSCG